MLADAPIWLGKFKMSAPKTSELIESEALLGMKELSLIEEVTTRWNSTLDMLERLTVIY